MKLERPFFSITPRSPWFWPFLALPSIAAGILVVVWPQAVTLMAGAAAGLFVLARPLLGLLIVLGLLYFPLFPNLNLGGLETSITGPLFLLLAGIALLRWRVSHSASQPLAAWQKALLAGLALAYALATLFSQDLPVWLAFAPNLVIYVITLFVVMTMIDSKERLVLTAKTILVLAFVLSIWRLELRPLRGIFGLPSLGINGAVLTYHPAVALSLVILVFPGTLFSARWRFFAGLALVSLVLHGILYETRAAWIVWSAMLLLMAARLPLRRWTRYLPLVILLFWLAGYFYLETLQANWEQTQQTFAATAEGENMQMNPDDRVRLLAQEAGLDMFYQQPFLGWGPNMFSYLKPEFVTAGGKEARSAGAFNAWLMVLAEMGAIGALATGLAAILPLLITWRLLGKPGTPEQQEIKWLAFGFALGAFGLAVHLLFIDLMFSFYWVHIGLALAATRLKVEYHHV